MKYPNDFWQTPGWLLSLIDEFFEGEWFDPCPALGEIDGLSIEWPPKVQILPKVRHLFTEVRIKNGLKRYFQVLVILWR